MGVLFAKLKIKFAKISQNSVPLMRPNQSSHPRKILHTWL